MGDPDYDTVAWHIGITRRFPWVPTLWWTADDLHPDHRVTDPIDHSMTSVGLQLLAAADAQTARSVIAGPPQ